METACGYLTEDHVMWFSSDEAKWKNRILNLAEQYPNEVKITVMPENNDGCLNATLPSGWLRIKPPIRRELTDEQRAELSERAKRMQMARKEQENEEETEDEE